MCDMGNGVHLDGSNEDHPLTILKQKADLWNYQLTDVEFARAMDSIDPLRDFRDKFFYPKKGKLPRVDHDLIDPDEDCVYFVGNSLGLQPKGVRQTIDRELDKWANWGVDGHHLGVMPWERCEECLEEQSALLVGAKREEVAIMNTLTVNIHLLMVSFYRPTSARHKIVLEKKAFPSDHYAVESQIRLHGFDPKTSLCLLEPRQGEETLRMEDILAQIEENGDSIALILLSGVQYYTGQLFDMEPITKAAQAKGCYVGIDLAHAIGNVELSLHDWGVDFACWCTYKYLNSGAGGVGGAFLHKKHKNNNFPKLQGWWSHKLRTRFQMDNVMDEGDGINAYRISNQPFLLCASLEASLDIFAQTSVRQLREKSKLLTGYLEYLLLCHYPKPSCPNIQSSAVYVDIITPSDPNQRGCQLSIKFSVPMSEVFAQLMKRGVLIDKREPDVIRAAPTPLYNSFEDVHRFVSNLGAAMEAARLHTKNVSSPACSA